MTVSCALPAHKELIAQCRTLSFAEQGIILETFNGALGPCKPQAVSAFPGSRCSLVLSVENCDGLIDDRLGFVTEMDNARHSRFNLRDI